MDIEAVGMGRRGWLIMSAAALVTVLVVVLLGQTPHPPAPAAGDPATAAAGSATTLKIVTANIRIPMAGDTGEKSWEERRDVLAQTLLARNPDILGTQETLPPQLAFLAQKLAGYQYVPANTKEDGLFGAVVDMISSMNIIFYRADRFTLLDSAHGPLRPEALQANPGENAFYTLAVLRDKQGVFGDLIVLDAHLRHQQANAIKSAERIHAVLQKELVKYPKARWIVLGDMNHEKGTPAYQALVAPGPTELVDTFNYAARGQERWGTYHAFKGVATTALPSDLIFVAPGLKHEPAEIGKGRVAGSGPWASDHFFVSVVVRAQ